MKTVKSDNKDDVPVINNPSEIDSDMSYVNSHMSCRITKLLEVGYTLINGETSLTNRETSLVYQETSLTN